MYSQYYKPPHVLHQRGHGIASFLGRVAGPLFRKVAPLARGIIRKHGKTVLKTGVRAAQKALAGKKNSKKAAVGVIRKALIKQLNAPAARASAPKKKKKKKSRAGGAARGRKFAPEQRHLYLKPGRMR